MDQMMDHSFAEVEEHHEKNGLRLYNTTQEGHGGLACTEYIQSKSAINILQEKRSL